MLKKVSISAVFTSFTRQGEVCHGEIPWFSLHLGQKGILTHTFEIFFLFFSLWITLHSVDLQVMEIRPSIDWNKGHALEYLLETLGFKDSSNVVPIYIGDDRTDEDAFEVKKNMFFHPKLQFLFYTLH